MKLNTFLSGLVGQTLTAEHVSTISTEIDGIRDRAVAKETEKLTALQKKHDALEAKNKTFEAEKADVGLKDAFIKAGGNADKFESFKKVSGQVDKLEDVNFEELFTEFPSLQGEAQPEDNPYNQFNNLQNTKDAKGVESQLPDGYVDSTIA